jgi:hypothetical protein
MATGLRICALNPIIGREYNPNLIPLQAKKRGSLLLGEAHAGMQAAITAAERGLTLFYAKSDRLGRALNCERAIPFKTDLYRFVATKARQMEKAGVTVRMSTEVTPDLCPRRSQAESHPCPWRKPNLYRRFPESTAKRYPGQQSLGA